MTAGRINRYEVTATVVDKEGINTYTLQVEARDPFEAESETHLILTVGDGLTVLSVGQVELIEVLS